VGSSGQAVLELKGDVRLAGADVDIRPHDGGAHVRRLASNRVLEEQRCRCALRGRDVHRHQRAVLTDVADPSPTRLVLDLDLRFEREIDSAVVDGLIQT
jgi:hypothetical protein